MDITYKEEFDLNNLRFSDAIDGLNKYFSEDETHKSFVEIECLNVYFYRLDAEMYLDKLIAWLRTKHGIFYYPGMEAKYAKTERIPPFTERIMDKGALNSLKKLYKNVTGEEDETGSHTLIASTISCNFNNKDRMISLLKEQNELLKDKIRNCNAELATKWTKTSLIDWLQQRARHKNVELDDSFLYSDDTQYDWTDIVDFLFDEIVKIREELISLETDLKKAKIEKEKFLIEVANRDEEIESLHKKDYELYLAYRHYIMKNIRYEASQNGFDLPEKVDGAPLSLEQAFRDLIERLKRREAEIKEVNEKRWKDLSDINKALGCSGMNGHVDDFAKAVKARAEYAESLSINTERSDINKLIRDYCTKNNIIPPSPYLSDEACVEYLFSVVDLEREHRAAVGKQMVDDYEKNLLQFIYKEYEGRIRKDKNNIRYSPSSVRNSIKKIISDYARSITRVEILETRIKTIFDKCKSRYTVDEYVPDDQTISFMIDCIGAWLRNGLTQPCKEKKSLIRFVKVISASVNIEPDALPELNVKMAIRGDCSFDNVLVDSICDDLIRYILKYGKDESDDS